MIHPVLAANFELTEFVAVVVVGHWQKCINRSCYNGRRTTTQRAVCLKAVTSSSVFRNRKTQLFQNSTERWAEWPWVLSFKPEFVPRNVWYSATVHVCCRTVMAGVQCSNLGTHVIYICFSLDVMNGLRALIWNWSRVDAVKKEDEVWHLRELNYHYTFTRYFICSSLRWKIVDGLLSLNLYRQTRSANLWMSLAYRLTSRQPSSCHRFACFRTNRGAI